MTVVRDGKEQIVEPIDLVPGDLVSVKSGEFVPADCRVVQVAEGTKATGSGVRDEYTVTTDPLSKSDPFWSATNCLLAHWCVIEGTLRAIVLHTGLKTSTGSVRLRCDCDSEILLSDVFSLSRRAPSAVFLRFSSFLSLSNTAPA